MSDNDDGWDPDAGADAHAGNDGSGINAKDAGSHDDDRGQLQAFYEEASINKMASIPRRPSSSSRNLSQQEEALSQHSAASLSLAEMSRMEETLLSQTSHHEEEEERQRKKMEKRERRAKGIKETKPPRPPTEIQIKRQKEYQRFKYKKGTDLSQEQDVGGSMEYLMREKLGEQAEQRRLRALALERDEQKKHKMEEEMTFLFDDGEKNNDEKDAAKSNDDHGVNWNFLEEGYVTMPRADASKLPYYVYRNSKRKLSSVLEVDSVPSKTSADVSGSHQKKRRKSGHLMFLKQNTTASEARNRGKLKTAKGNAQLKQHNKSQRSQRKWTLSVDEPDNVTRSFPLHFNQLKTRMDLHQMIDTKTVGSERMVLTHGRNAKRLWTRMVAGGIMNDDHDASNDIENDNNAKGKSDDDSISNVSSSSSSSKSSAQSYQPTAAYSQMSYGTTSVIGMGKVNDTNDSDETTKQNPLLRLMSMVHALPKATHRQQLLMKVAQELGTNRRLWEDEFRCLVEGIGDAGGCEDDGNSNMNVQRRVNLTATECWAIKSFLGVDGNISTPPSWMSDPSIPTHPTVLKQRMHGLRSSLLTRFRRFIQKEQQKVDGAADSEDIIETAKEGAGSGLESSLLPKLEEADENLVSDKDVESEIPDHGKDSHTIKTEDVVNVMADSNDNNYCEPTDSPKEDSQYLKEEGEEGGPEMVDESTKLLSSLIDEIQNKPDLGGVDKYAKLIHESNIDTSNITVALATFLDQLTSSKALLRQKQELDSSHFQHRHALNLAREDVGHWHETIVSYLAFAETLAQPRDANFYKSGNSFPESVPLAQAVMATQSYFANGGGVGCGRKRKSFQSSLWEVKEENCSSDESEASDTNNDEPGTSFVSDPKHSLNNLEKKELHGIHLAAKEIAKRGKDSLANKHLTSFTPIHLTTGIAMIAENLTPHAVELVSRPCSENMTPFDLISNMLTSIEEDGSLISPPQSSWDSKGKIIDGMLVQSMLEAAMVFRKCIEQDPENVDHWCWYVATYLGMLCIAFGTTTASRIHEQTERPR